MSKLSRRSLILDILGSYNVNSTLLGVVTIGLEGGVRPVVALFLVAELLVAGLLVAEFLAAGLLAAEFLVLFALLVLLVLLGGTPK